MAFNPCCMSLQRGTKIVAIIDAVIGILIFLAAVLVIWGITSVDEIKDGWTESDRSTILAISIVLAIVRFSYVVLAFFLYFGAKRRNYRHCQIWTIISELLLVVGILISIVNLVRAGFGVLDLAVSLVDWAYKIYELLVVYAFLKEMGQGAQQSSTVENPGMSQGQPPVTFAYPVVVPMQDHIYASAPPPYSAQQYYSPPPNPNDPSPVIKESPL